MHLFQVQTDMSFDGVNTDFCAFSFCFRRLDNITLPQVRDAQQKSGNMETETSVKFSCFESTFLEHAHEGLARKLIQIERILVP